MVKYFKIPMLIFMVISMIFVGCTNDDVESDVILKPIEKHILGKWEITKFMMFTNGKWTEESGNNVNGIDAPENVTMTFSNDGTLYHIYPLVDTVVNRTDGQLLPVEISIINSDTWDVDNETNRLTITNMIEAEIFKLTDNELEWGKRGFIENEKQEMKYVCTRKNIDEKSLIEKLIGKWNYIYSNEKINDKWEATDDAGNPDGQTFEFKEDGTFKIYNRNNENNEYYDEGHWGITLGKNGLFTKYTSYHWGIFSVEMTNDDTLILSYSVENDRGEMADFQDIFERFQ